MTSEIASPTKRTFTSRKTVVRELRDLLGGDVVLLPIKSGGKGPRLKGWQDFTTAKFDDPAYVRRLSAGNIGVLLGKASGGLCSIDIDADEALSAFLELNPLLKQTLQTRGARGGNIWVRILGNYPPYQKLQTKTTDEVTKPQPWGEWRADGVQTVIFGKHPKGHDYRMTHIAKPIEIEFKAIVWPDNLHVPWDFAEYENLVRLHGEPYSLGEKGGIHLNKYFYAVKFNHERLVTFEPDEDLFYTYDPAAGLWLPQTDDYIKNQLALDWKIYGDTQQLPTFVNLRTSALLNELVSMLKGLAEKRGVFKRDSKTIHLGNGMLHLDAEPPELREFSPIYYSRNQCPIILDENADCPRFKKELLEAALPPDDISLLQRWTGSVLLGGNPAQRILLLTGTAGGGKGTVTEIVEKVIGLRNVAELRTEHLGVRFEIAAFAGKTLLAGKDVGSDFLSRQSATYLKKLVGHDFMQGELKSANARSDLRGDFAVVICSNSRLRIYLEDDADAWRRRLLIIEYQREKPMRPIPNFADELLKEESAGILNWMIEGAIMHLDELKNTGNFILTAKQQDRIEQLLAASDSVREFVVKCIKPASDSVKTETLFGAYELFCQACGYKPVASILFSERIKPLLMAHHNAKPSHDIREEGDTTDRRGFRGITVEVSL